MIFKKFMFNRKKKKVENLEYESTNGCPFVEQLFCSNFFSIFHKYNKLSIEEYREEYGYNSRSLNLGLLVYKIHNTIITIDEELSNSSLKIKTNINGDTLVYGSYDDFYNYFNSKNANISPDMYSVKKLFDMLEKTHYSKDINIELVPEKIQVIDRYNNDGIQYLCILSSNDRLIHILNNNYIKTKTYIIKHNDITYRYLSFMDKDITDTYNIIKNSDDTNLLELKNILNTLFFINDDEDNIESNDLYYTNIDEILD